MWRYEKMLRVLQRHHSSSEEIPTGERSGSRRSFGALGDPKVRAEPAMVQEISAPRQERSEEFDRA
jgi:hypothetical protein